MRRENFFEMLRISAAIQDALEERGAERLGGGYVYAPGWSDERVAQELGVEVTRITAWREYRYSGRYQPVIDS